MRRITALLLFLTVMQLGAAAAAAPASDRIRAAVERQQDASSTQRSIAQHLQRLVDGDSAFDPGRPAPRAPDPETQAVYDGVLCLLDDSLRAQFCGFSAAALREEWLRRFWVLQDPTPTTPENERLDEHRNRVQRAREQFAAEQSSWDDRGTFYILYGAPLAVSRTPADVDDPLGYIPERVIWHYEDGVAAPFELRSPPAGPWTFGLSGKTFTSRPHVALHDALRPTNDPGVPSASVADPMNSAREALAMAAARTVFEARHERFTMPGAPARQLWFVFDTDVFRLGGYGAAGEPSRTTVRLEAHLQFAVSDLSFRWADSLYSARYRVEGLLLDADLHEAGRDAYEMDLTANRFDTTNRAQLWPGQLDFAVPPGAYRLALRLVDVVSGAQGAYTADIDVPRAEAPRLGISDIELATNIVPAGGYAASRFLKAGRLVLPNPIGLYALGSPFMAYFEIYGLELDSKRGSRYRISYRIEARDPGSAPRRRRRPRSFVTASFVSTAQTPNPVEELRIDIDHLDEASYELVIEIEDLVGSGKAVARTPFAVVRL